MFRSAMGDSFRKNPCMRRYLSDFLGKQSTNKDDEDDFTDRGNVLLTHKDDVTEQDQECQVGKLEYKKQSAFKLVTG